MRTGHPPLFDQRVEDEWDPDLWDDPEYAEAAVVERAPRRSRLFKWVVFGVASILVVAVLTAGAVGWWYIRQVNPSGEVDDSVEFTVRETDTLQTISERLQANGVITNARVFRYYVDSKGGIDVSPGYYELHPRDHMGNIMRVLNTPPAATYKRITFPEGFTVAQMGKRVERDLPPMTAAGFAQAAASTNITTTLRPPGITSLEGLLFPDTYQVAGNESEAQVISRMIALMERVGRQENLDAKAAELGMTPYQILIIASMIEREAKFDSDRAKIARVIYNRLSPQIDIPLQIDATLYYGAAPDASFSDLKATDTPYNTYIHSGLPPTPIANPGRASIEAALNPAPNPGLGDPLCRDLQPDQPCAYVYYVVSDAEGHHVFAATIDQHNANVAAARAAGLLD